MQGNIPITISIIVKCQVDLGTESATGTGTPAVYWSHSATIGLKTLLALVVLLMVIPGQLQTFCGDDEGSYRQAHDS
jgi:hypothetical protein